MNKCKYIEYESVSKRSTLLMKQQYLTLSLLQRIFLSCSEIIRLGGARKVTLGGEELINRKQQNISLRELNINIYQKPIHQRDWDRQGVKYLCFRGCSNVATCSVHPYPSKIFLTNHTFSK